MCIFCSNICGTCDAAPDSAGASALYRFARSDFGKVPMHPLHYDLHFSFNSDTSVTVKSSQTYFNTTQETVATLALNAHDLRVDGVEVLSAPHAPLGPPPVGIDAKVPDFVAHVEEINSFASSPAGFDYNKDKRVLTVSLPKGVPPGGEVVIKTTSTTFPDDKQLEGIYFDATPPGKPQTMISQCQQYGFQRIVPCVDTMNAKTFFTTTIRASKEYTNIITNGDKVEEKVEGDVKKVKFVNHTVNMAPYLFFIGVGTYVTHVGEVEYPSGQKFDVELLCLPGVVEKTSDARQAIKALVDSIIWTQLCTGPEKYEHEAERREVFELMKERDALKASSADPVRLSEVRQKLKFLMSAWTDTGYTYPFKTYREIAMENSNYGGMENLNNTTILSSRLTPSRWLVDGGYVYMEGVKVHEFYHNINGSQATGETPFEIWLNEAVTVHIQRQREDEIFGHNFMRLGQLMYAQMPGSGPLALDRAPSSMAVEPAGFNTTHELISAMTYSKAPEFIRMVQSILGEEKFVKALFEYHSKFAFSNATSWQWVECMAAYAPSNVDLTKMAKGWLQRTGYPTIVVEKETWVSGKTILDVKQTGFESKTEAERYPWVVPIACSAVKNGAVISSELKIFDQAEGTIEIATSEQPDFISIACDWSFYGDVRNDAMTDAQKFAQAKTDPDAVNRFLAFQSILDDEKERIVQALRAGSTDGLVTVTPEFIELYGAILHDSNLAPSAKGQFLGISSSCPSHPGISHLYVQLASARTAILQAIYATHGAELKKLFNSLSVDSKLENRRLKYAVYAAIRAGIAAPAVIGDDGSKDLASGRKEATDLIAPLLHADNMSDRGSALLNMVELGGEAGRKAREEAKKTWTSHPIGCEQYITTIANVDSDESTTLIRELIKEPFFNMALAGHARTVGRAWCSNQKRALLTKKGLALTKDLFAAVGKVNQMSAYCFIGLFGLTSKFEEASIKKCLVDTVVAMKDGLHPKEQESLFNQLSRLIDSF